LADKNAAVVVKDSEVKELLLSELFNLLENESKMEELKFNIKKFAKPEAAEDIVNDILRLTGIK